jgi:hypothetical protein
MNEEMHPETNDRDDEYPNYLMMFIPFVLNHLAHGRTPEECQRLLPFATKEQFDRLLAEISALGENPHKNLCEDSLGLEPIRGLVGCVERG